MRSTWVEGSDGRAFVRACGLAATFLMGFAPTAPGSGASGLLTASSSRIAQ